MGTALKGDAPTYHSISENISRVSSKYEYQDGKFGQNSPSTGTRTRNIVSSDPLATAKDFYDNIAYGGIERALKNGNLHITHMADGTIISMRNVSSSDGSPVVEINISRSSSPGDMKNQKIHFIEGEK